VTDAGSILTKVVAWTVKASDIRRLLLVGSRAREVPPDDLADIDLQVYAETPARYTQHIEWLSEIAEVWVCVRDNYPDQDIQVPTLLTIFEGGVKIDFAFYPAGTMSAGIRSGLPHKTLVDKDPSGTPDVGRSGSVDQVCPPTEGEFRRVVEEFWFEAWHVAKYLARDELWLAKSRDQAAKQFLLTMIQWHDQCVCGRRREPDDSGKRGSMSDDTWQALHECFGAFSRELSWAPFFATTELFRRLGKETAAALGFVYPADVDANISGWIETMRRR
jgi:aminoglycoside 6-adenylyltransferase